jgi:dihydroorotate dehydrogenase
MIEQVRQAARNQIETMQGETLKSAAEMGLQLLGDNVPGAVLLDLYAHGVPGRIENPALHTTVAGLEFDNPVQFGAGWDKRGRALLGLYHLGCSGGELGTVLPFGQYGNPKPRLWTINDDHSVEFNRLGFNSKGREAVQEQLDKLGPLPFPLGISVGKNKIMPNELAPWAHADVVGGLYEYAAYFVHAISSPNTPDLRMLQGKGFLRDILQESNEKMESLGGRKPSLIKIDAERTPSELDDMIEVALEEGAAGFVACNTYMGSDLKAAYGERWAHEAGGLSGDDPRYRALANRTIRYIYEQAGDKLEIIGAGGVKDTATAVKKIENGASAVQVLTAIRSTKGRVAGNINRGLLVAMRQRGVSNVSELVGTSTDRGVKALAA